MKVYKNSLLPSFVLGSILPPRQYNVQSSSTKLCFVLSRRPPSRRVQVCVDALQIGQQINFSDNGSLVQSLTLTSPSLNVFLSHGRIVGPIC